MADRTPPPPAGPEVASPDEHRAAQALAEALDGKRSLDDPEVDQAAVEAAALMRQAPAFELSPERMAAVRARLEGRIPDATLPRRRRAWLWVAGPALAAAAGLLLFVQTGQMAPEAPMAAEMAPAPAPAKVRIDAPVIDGSTVPAAPPALVAAHARMVAEGRADDAAFEAGLAEYRASVLAAVAAR